jgi:hypothetical protein
VGVGRQRLGREPAGHGGDVGRRQALRDLRHAVGRMGFAQAGLPGAELADQVVARQAQQAGGRRVHAGHAHPVTGGAGRQLARRVALAHQAFAVGQLLARRLGGRRWRVGQVQAGKVLRDVAQVGITQVVKQVAHAVVLAPAVAEVQQLVVEVTGRLARDAREEAVVGGAAFGAVTAGAGLQPLGQGVGHGVFRRRRLVGGLGAGQRSGQAGRQQGEGERGRHGTMRQMPVTAGGGV